MGHGPKWIALIALVLAERNGNVVDARRDSNFAVEENGSGSGIDFRASDQIRKALFPGYSSPARQNRGFSQGSRSSRRDIFVNGNFPSGAESANPEPRRSGNAISFGSGFGRRRGNAFDALSGSNPNKHGDDTSGHPPEENVRGEQSRKNWVSETETDGRGDFEVWPSNKRSGGNGIGSWQPNFGPAGNSNQLLSGWNPKQKESQAGGFGDGFSDNDRGDPRRGHSNGRISNAADKRKSQKVEKSSGSDGNSNKWKSKPVGQNPKPFLSATDDWYKTDNGKQTTFSSNSSPSANAEGIDWNEIERENKKSVLSLNLSQLWYPSYKSNERGTSSNFRLAKKRAAERKEDANEETTCICTEYEDCQARARIELLLNGKGNIPDIRPSNVLKCIAKGKACCLVRALTENQEVAEYRKTSSMNRFPVCGRRLSNRVPPGSDSGTLADHGDFPWILRLLYSRDDGGAGGARLQCGASLVHPSIALTTATCVLGAAPESLSAVSGEWNIATGHGRNDIWERKIEKVVVHPMFDAFHFANDLALLFLEEPPEDARPASGVCLPVPNRGWSPRRCLIVGWSLKNEDGENQPLLRKIDVAIISQGKCRNRFNALEFDRSYLGLGDAPFICAYAQDEEDPCLDDGGASLVCPSEDNPDSYVQIGFLSQKTICNQEQRAATFTTVFNILDWVSQLETNYFSSES